MSSKQIVIYTKTDDPTVDAVLLQLQKEGQAPIRLNTDEIPLHGNLNLNCDGNKWQGNIKINTSEQKIDINQIRSVWWRRPEDFKFPPEFSEDEEKFAKLEMSETMRGFWGILDCYWISFHNSIRNAGCKIEQLQRASKMGFEVPRTLVTTEPSQVKAFHASCQGKIIFKVFSDPFLGFKAKHEKIVSEPPALPKTVKTTLMTDKELAQLHSEKLIPPCLFQEYIPKRVELRVTVIGDEVFAAEIDSQMHEETRIDWRDYSIDTTFRKANLPPYIEERCLKFVHSYGLNYSAMDIILTPDGRYVFLENNPNGQFVFVQLKLPELRMIEALSACLIRGANS